MRCVAAISAGLLLALVAPARTARAQAAWEYSPYRVRVRVALAPAPQLPAATLPLLAETVAARSRAVLGPIWQVETLAAPAFLRDELLRGDASQDEIAAAVPEDLNGDKLFLAAIAYREGGFQIRVRELDCRARQLGDEFERTAYGLPELRMALWDALTESFTPLARIELVDGNNIGCRLRAGGLIVDQGSRALVQAGMVLRPIIRRNDRSGQPLKGGVQTIPWTLLTVNERRDSLLDCTLETGYRIAIPTRGSSRVERLALLVRPRWPATTLVLRSRSEADKPLAGYEIHTRLPGEEQTAPLGVTDSAGEIELTGGSLMLVYVKSGKQLLAKLPMLPGQSQSLVAELVDDDPRLAAEGLIVALQSRALDLVARREILAARIRARLKAGELDQAQALLDDFRKLETRLELGRDLDRYRQQVSSSDRLTQSRIDKLFAEAQKLLTLKPLSDEMLSQLTRELTAARSGSSPPAGSAGS